jgi:hypothetical protein
MSLCPRGYVTSKKYFYPFPNKKALKFADDVCNGLEPDWTGKTEKSPSHTRYINVEFDSDINGFNRFHAEKWINVCTKMPCIPTYHNKTCVPEFRTDDKTSLTINEMSQKQINELCSQYRPSYPDSVELKEKLTRVGINPVSQVTYKDKSIGFTDADGQFHIAKPSPIMENMDVRVLAANPQ